MSSTTRSLISALLGIAALVCLGAARAQPEAPDVLVKNVTLEVVDLIAKDQEIKSGNRAKLIQVIDAKVLPHFNFAAMTALALGQNWNKTTPEQKKRLTQEFRTLLVRTYASALAAYSAQKFDFRPLRAKAGDTALDLRAAGFGDRGPGAELRGGGDEFRRGEPRNRAARPQEPCEPARGVGRADTGCGAHLCVACRRGRSRGPVSA